MGNGIWAMGLGYRLIDFSDFAWPLAFRLMPLACIYLFSIQKYSSGTVKSIFFLSQGQATTFPCNPQVSNLEKSEEYERYSTNRPWYFLTFYQKKW
jgi:hypothetical protein